MIPKHTSQSHHSLVAIVSKFSDYNFRERLPVYVQGTRSVPMEKRVQSLIQVHVQCVQQCSTLPSTLNPRSPPHCSLTLFPSLPLHLTPSPPPPHTLSTSRSRFLSISHSLHLTPSLTPIPSLLFHFTLTPPLYLTHSPLSTSHPHTLSQRCRD